MTVPPCKWNRSFLDRQPEQVEGSSQIYSRAHGTPTVNTHKILLDTDRRRGLGVELPGDGTMLLIKRLRIRADNDVRLG